MNIFLNILEIYNIVEYIFMRKNIKSSCSSHRKKDGKSARQLCTNSVIIKI